MYFSVLVDSNGCTPEMDVDVCLLCGFLMNMSVEKRNKQLSTIIQNLTHKCMATELVFKNVLTLYKEMVADQKNKGRVCQRVPLCIACENWRRRLV